MIKKLFILVIFLSGLALQAKSEYSEFIQEQMNFIHQMNDNSNTKEAIQTLVIKQERSYVNTIEYIMSNKQDYSEESNLYVSEISTLMKMIKINKRAGNKYAVMRDEVQLKSYNVLRNQHEMIRETLAALDTLDIKIFREKLNKIISQNQLENEKYTDIDYKTFLEKNIDRAPVSLKTNIQEFYDLIEINKDVISHLYSFEKRMYRLNKYSKYHLVAAVVYINNTRLGEIINPFLEKYNLNLMKILFIFSLSLFLYLIRIIIHAVAQLYFTKIGLLEKYSKDILQKSRQPLSILIILINIEFVSYIYNDFVSIENVNKFFNVLYAFLFVWFVYRVVNIITNIKIQEMNQLNKQIKNEMINVGKKLVNFLIILIGLLFILYLVGVNLTAVLSGLGIGGLAVALAAKDSLSNFFGTLSILLSDVISQGDWIVVNGEEGVVIEIGLRVTTLRTFDNALIAIPNAILANNDVKNWNKRTLGRRIKMNLGIKYDSKSEDIKNAVNEIRTMLDKHPAIATKNTKYTYSSTHYNKLVSKDDLQGVKKTLLVYLDEFSASSINILVYCFTKSIYWEEWLQTKEDVMYKMMLILEKNNLEFAFPSMSIYHENEFIAKNKV